MPTAVDPSLTDDGTTIVTMFTQFGPWNEEGWPEGSREAYGHACFDLLAQHAPEREGRAARLRGARPARTCERIFGLDGGSIFQGEQDLDADGVHAPDAGALALRHPGRTASTSCGAGTHPGGGVISASGHNAAQRVLRDMRGDKLRVAGLRPRQATAR